VVEHIGRMPVNGTPPPAIPLSHAKQFQPQPGFRISRVRSMIDAF